MQFLPSLPEQADMFLLQTDLPHCPHGRQPVQPISKLIFNILLQAEPIRPLREWCTVSLNAGVQAEPEADARRDQPPGEGPEEEDREDIP